jgi:hypothetical protein
MFERLRESREAAQAQKARTESEQRLSILAWEANRAYEAWRLSKLEDDEGKVPGMQFKKGEIAYLVTHGIGLVEPRRGPSTWVGGSQGVSFKISKHMRYRVGATKGHLVQGDEEPTVIDQGLGVVTNQRMVFVGSKRTMEWAYSKLLGYSLEQQSMAIFNVSNRQKASGFAYSAEHDLTVDAVISAAIAAFDSPEEHAAVVEGYLENYLAAHAAWDSLNRELNPGPPP